MKKNFYLFVMLLMALCMVGCNQNEPTSNKNKSEGGDSKEPTTETIVDGVQGNVLVNAVFQINQKGDKVCFSKGNLQFNAAQGTHQCADGKTLKGTWRFAENQYDFIDDDDNYKRSSTYDGWIDLFAWGTSGWNNTSVDKYYIHYQPWEEGYFVDGNDFEYYYNDYYKTYNNKYSNDNFYGYGPSSNQGTGDLTGINANADWGVYNQIGNDAPGTWRTLTRDEWKYIIDHSKHLYTNVCGTYGYILVSSDWQKPDGVEWGSKEYFTNEWKKMQANGAVFLPRIKISTYYYYYYDYWSSTHSEKSYYADYEYERGDHSQYAGTVTMETNYIETSSEERYSVSKIRLVKDL